MKARSMKCVSFCLIRVFEDFEFKCYNKVRKEVFLLRRAGYVSTSYYYSSLGIRYFCSLCLWGECLVCASGTPQNKIPLEACFCDSLFNFSPPCNLCCLARFLLWFKCLKSIIHLDIQKIHLVFRWDGLFLFLGDIFIFTMMISHIENRVKAYMTYLHFFLSKWQDNFVSIQRKFPCVGFCSIIVNRQKDRNVL